MATADVNDLARRAESLAVAARDAGLAADVVVTEALAGGGAGEGVRIPSRASTLRSKARNADDLLKALRQRNVPVIGRIEDGAVVLDLRSVPPEDDAELAEAIRGLGRD